MKVLARPVEDGDDPALAKVLNGWFASYRDHLDYAPPTLDFLKRWMWGQRSASVLLEADGQLAAMCLTGVRPARFRGKDLRVGHIGPLAVNPFLRRKGLGVRVTEAACERAAELGCDAVTLLTQEIYPAHKLYRRAKFRQIERFQPHGAAIGEVQAPPWAKEVSAATFVAARPERAGRPGAVVECRGSDLPQSAPPDVVVRTFLGPDAGVATVTWPVRVRVHGSFISGRSCQLFDAWGEGTPLMGTIAAALSAAHAEGCEGAYYMPWSGLADVPGFSAEGGPWVLRMSYGLTPLGEAVVDACEAWDAVDPSP